jgi:predicted O-methyltransferase YrrM
VTLDEFRALAEPCPDGYHRWPEPYRQMAVTLEDAEWLYALVRLMRPARVLELGGGLGVSAKFIGSALAEFGMLRSIEPERRYRVALGAMVLDLPVGISGSDEDCDPEEYDLVFIDSGYDRREQDIARWVGAGPLVVVHDAARDYSGLRGRGAYVPCADGMWLGSGA